MIRLDKLRNLSASVYAFPISRALKTISLSFLYKIGQDGGDHPQFTQFPERDVTFPGPVPVQRPRFLNRDFTDSGIRTMWVQLTVLF